MCAVDIAVHYIPASAICQFETFSFFCARGPPSACRRLGRIILVHLCTIFSRFSPRPAILVHLCTIFPRSGPRPIILVHLCTIFARHPAIHPAPKTFARAAIPRFGSARPMALPHLAIPTGFPIGPKSVTLGKRTGPLAAGATGARFRERWRSDAERLAPSGNRRRPRFTRFPQKPIRLESGRPPADDHLASSDSRRSCRRRMVRR